MTRNYSTEPIACPVCGQMFSTKLYTIHLGNHARRGEYVGKERANRMAKRAAIQAKAVDIPLDHDEGSFLEQLGEAVAAALGRAVAQRDEARKDLSAAKELLSRTTSSHVKEAAEWAAANKTLTEERDKLADQLNTKALQKRRYTLDDLKNLIAKV